MLGIEAIGTYIPANKVSNFDRMEEFGIDESFIEDKIGIRQVAVKSDDEETSDLCIRAFDALSERADFIPEEIDTLVVVTQNPDQNIPHVSAMVHARLGLPNSCACFDISLGCSGYVYALSVILAFMQANDRKKGLLFTADPYSKIIDPKDKNTALLFGDAATVTLVSEQPLLSLGKFTFGTLGSEHDKLICRDGILSMHGRAVFNFAVKTVTEDIRRMAEANDIPLERIDRFLLHQGSRIIVDTMTRNLKIDPDKVPYKIQDYGNTVSSTIPLLLADELHSSSQTIAVCGFGVGLSWASGLLRRVKDPNT